jgi:signal transduction histidine kinase/CheY-like chemotaxis protein
MTSINNPKINNPQDQPKILIIDDEPDVLKTLEKILTLEGYLVTSASEGKSAIDIFKSEPFDLVLTDMRMPGMDGLEVMGRIKRLDEDVEVIVLTGFATLENAITAFRKYGAFGYLTKPFENIDDLLVTVSQALEKRGLRMANKALVKELRNARENLETQVREKTRLNVKLQESKTLLQTVVDGISDPLILFDKGLNVKVLNNAALKYYGIIEFKDVVGMLCHEAFRGRSEPCEGCAIPSGLLAGESKSFERKGIMDPERLEEVFVYPLGEDDSKTGSAIIRISDITEKKLMQKRLMHSEKLASIGFLVSGIAHEINNPNNFITFNIPLLRDYLNDLIPIIDDYAKGREDFELFGMPYPEFRKDIFKLIENIEHGSSRITGIVSSLKEFSRKKDAGELKDVDLRQVIEKGVLICRGKIKEMVKSLEVNLPDDLPLIHTYPDSLEQVLVNLLINAAQAADKEDSWVRVEVESGEADRDLIMIVSDNGSGMDDETQKRIFDPFFTTRFPGQGTGMGLSVCHNLVEELGGRIEVESEVGKGSTLRVILPRIVD